jgi:hypothetical protein
VPFLFAESKSPISGRSGLTVRAKYPRGSPSRLVDRIVHRQGSREPPLRRRMRSMKQWVEREAIA